jgi:hypothetical protein
MKLHDKLRLHDKFLQSLATAQKQRGERDDWMLFERQTMLDAVNAERAARSRPPVSMAEIERADRLASGHSDYSRKFALYCAELVDA